jgi:hypothetical protein
MTLALVVGPVVLVLWLVLSRVVRPRSYWDRLSDDFESVRFKILYETLLNRWPANLHMLRQLVMQNPVLLRRREWTAFLGTWLQRSEVVDGEESADSFWDDPTHRTAMQDDLSRLSVRTPLLSYVLPSISADTVVAIMAIAIAYLSYQHTVTVSKRAAVEHYMQRRPWLVADLPQVTLQLDTSGWKDAGDTMRDSLLVDYRLRNVGGGAAGRCKVVEIGLDTSVGLQLALTAEESLAGPVYPMPAGDSMPYAKRLQMWRIGPVDTALVLYLRIKALCCGVEVPDTFYMESVYYLRPYAGIRLGFGKHARSKFACAEDYVYRRLVGRRVVPE